MFTGNIEYIRHIYKVEKVLPSYTVFGLVDVSNTERIKIPSFLRIEPFRLNTNTHGTSLILRGREYAKWASKTITGLRPTTKDGVYFGTHTNNLPNLMLFQISECGDTLIIDYFNGFYPSSPRKCFGLIENHRFYY